MAAVQAVPDPTTAVDPFVTDADPVEYSFPLKFWKPMLWNFGADTVLSRIAERTAPVPEVSLKEQFSIRGPCSFVAERSSVSISIGVEAVKITVPSPWPAAFPSQMIETLLAYVVPDKTIGVVTKYDPAGTHNSGEP
jgi:hypothetical protein